MKIPTNYIISEQSIIIPNNEKDNLYIMFNCILDVFLIIGVSDNGEPNDVGMELETLNTKINHEYVIFNSKRHN